MLVRYAILILLAVPLWGYAQLASSSDMSASTDVHPSVSEIAASYTNLLRITTNVVYVNPELAILCKGASKEEVESARTRLGPHANTGILIYMNKLAADAFAKKATPFPVGAVVVKRKMIHGYTDKNGRRVGAGGAGVGGMVKRSPGYDPKHGDWEYFYFEDARKIETGRIASCVQCHESARNRDYVFGSWLGTDN